MADFDLTPAAEVEHKLIEYFWHDRIPRGQIILMAGRQGGGKSTIVSDIIAHVTRDLKQDAILSNQEDAESVVKARLEAAGGDLDHVMLAANPGYSFPEDIGLLTMHILAKQAKLCVFDTAAQHLGCNMNNDQDVRKALSPLMKVAEMTGCTMLLVTHVTKHVSKNSYPLSAIGGSGGITGAARGAFFVGPNPDNVNERVCVWVKDQYRPLPLGLSFELEGYNILDDDDKLVATTQRAILSEDGVDIDPMAVLSGKARDDDGAGPKADKRALAAEWLTVFLSAGKQGATEVRDAGALAGLSWATIRRAADDVTIEKYREGFGKGSKLYWQLPDGHPALVSDEDVEADELTDEELVELHVEALVEDKARTAGTTTITVEDTAVEVPVLGVEDVAVEVEATLTDEDIAALLGGS